MLIAYEDADVCSRQRSNWMPVNRKPTWGEAEEAGELIKIRHDVIFETPAKKQYNRNAFYVFWSLSDVHFIHFFKIKLTENKKLSCFLT